MKGWFASLGVAACLLGPNAAQAVENALQKLSDPGLHCGSEPSFDLFNGVMNALSEPQSTAAELTLRREDRTLELLIHFKKGESEIPPDCLPKLHALNDATKTGKSGPILIRSSTRAEGSTELDLALASQRLDALQNYLRDNRLARRAFVLELHPETSSPLFGEAIALPNVVEVYSSPAN
ncbi:hypothetical protein [Limnobacter parvus]|uniref:OmpA-like domain-containing protein n=1 Tax=Limnobacter parvus TaxID=2939690 RepID=A0ABT1XG79_9BURK|nr:hypothetical protein [Limnobacter parvus]MCR2746280.1 hypothetical protein [Limnobacter parvus]